MVHRTNITEDKVFILQLLRDQISHHVYPAHRLDRGTSGVLLFAKSGEIAAHLGAQFRDQEILKEYVAIIRGFVNDNGIIDSPLKDAHGAYQNAETRFERIHEKEVLFAVNRYPTSRYSYVKIKPLSGKYHQIRRHFAHIRHPIIGDKKHGDCKHNKYLSIHYGLGRMLLHANELQFKHPLTNCVINLKAKMDDDFRRFIRLLTDSKN